MAERPQDLARRLADQAEAVCRHYLSNGRRQGNYWSVGDVRNARGRSMFVRLKDGARGPAGRWTDAATGEHGDLLDVVRESMGLIAFRDVAREARAFLCMPMERSIVAASQPCAPAGSIEAAQRLFAMSGQIQGTLVEAYLRRRGIETLHEVSALRFHPRCYHRPDDQAPTQTWPAMIAAVTDLNGRLTGVHRTWLDPAAAGKAPVETPRRAMGDLLGNAVRFGVAGDVVAAGEGIETILSLRCALPEMAMAAALSAAHLAAIVFPHTLKRLYIVRDDDPAGDGARDILLRRARAAGVEAIVLSPEHGDFNEDLCLSGLDPLCAALSSQLVPQDAARFLSVPA